MPNEARKHVDMLQICCGVCGWKKAPNQLRKITDNILMQMKCIDGYLDYDLHDDRYPKMICNNDRLAISERYINPNNESYNFSLPSVIPQYNDISLPHIGTRATPSGYDDDHTCFLCDQNKVGRPVNKYKASDPITHNCPKCLQRTGRGIPHPCLKSKKQLIS